MLSIDVAVAVSTEVLLTVAAAVTLRLSRTVSEDEGHAEYDGKDVMEASSVTDISADTVSTGLRLIDSTGDRDVDFSAEEDRDGGGDREMLEDTVPVLELVKDWLGLAECEVTGEPVVVVLGVLEFAGVLLVTSLAVWDTDTRPVLEVAGLSDSFGVVDEKGELETEALGSADSDSAGLVEMKAVAERLDVIDGLCVTEADPESL